MELTVQESLKMNFFDRKKLKEFAGLCLWVGSVVPIVKLLMQVLWAAAWAPPSKELRSRSVLEGKGADANAVAACFSSTSAKDIAG